MLSKFTNSVIAAALLVVSSAMSQELTPWLKISRLGNPDGLAYSSVYNSLIIKNAGLLSKSDDTTFVFHNCLNKVDQILTATAQASHVWGFDFGSFVNSGDESTQTLGFHCVYTSDGGNSWKMKEEEVIPIEVYKDVNIITTKHGYARHSLMVSWDSLKTFVRHPIHDSLKESNFQKSYDYIEPYGFTIRSNRKQPKWYGLQKNDTAWHEIELPGEYDQIRQIQDSILVGLIPNYSDFVGIAIKKNSDTSWQQHVTFVTDSGDTLKNLRLSIPFVVDAKYWISVVNNTSFIIVFDGNSISVLDTRTLNSLWSIEPDVIAVFGSKLLFVARGPLGRKLVLYDLADDSFVTIKDLGGFLRKANARPVMTRNQIVFGTISFDEGQLVVWDIPSGKWIRKGWSYLDGEFDLAESFVHLYTRGDTIVVTDEHRGVYTFHRNDTTLLCLTLGIGLDLGLVGDFGVPDFKCRNGYSPAWADDSGVFAGGYELKRYNFDNSESRMLTDTVTCVARDKDGTIIAGYNDLVTSTDNGLTWDTIECSIESDSASEPFIIGTILPSSNGRLFIGGHGFPIDPETDTTRIRAGGLRYSDDNGQSWTNAFLPVTDLYVHSLIEDKEGTLWLSTTDVRQITYFDYIYNKLGWNFRHDRAVLMRSTDNGTTWEVIVTKSFSNTIFTATTFNVSISPKGTISFATPDVVLLSDDNGTTWSEVYGGTINTKYNSASFDHTGDLWIAASDGIYKWVNPTSVSEKQNSDKCKDLHVTQHTIGNESTLTITRLAGINNNISIVDINGRRIECRQTQVDATTLECSLNNAPTGLYVVVSNEVDCVQSAPVFVVRTN